MKEEPTKLILPSTIEHVKELPKEWYDPSEGVDCVLYRWQGAFSLSTTFPNGIPISVSEQKQILYPLIKDFLGITEWEDILEDNGGI